MEAEINFGRINADKCDQLTKLINLDAVDEFFICGPEEMIFGVSDFLEQKRIPNIKNINTNHHH